MTRIPGPSDKSPSIEQERVSAEQLERYRKSLEKRRKEDGTGDLGASMRPTKSTPKNK